jgi:hypothetical protein
VTLLFVGITVYTIYLSRIEIAAEEIKDKLNASVLFCDRHQEVFLPHLIKGVYRVGIPWWCKRKNAEIKLDRKEKILKKKTAQQKKVQRFEHK